MSATQLRIKSALGLPQSSHKIPQIGFGVYQSPPEKCVNSCLKALEAGYRHIDTAQYYENEDAVGRALRESKLPRSEVYITTKILAPGNDLDSTYQKVLDSVEKLAGKDGYVDLFLIHTPNGGANNRKLMWQALEKAKEAKKVREIGVSNYGIQHIEEIRKIGKVWPPAVNQIEVRSPPFSCVFTLLTRHSCTLGASNAFASTTAKRTKLWSKPTVPSSATRRRKTPLSFR
jgi:diketogulonate reductase-like aldo/keto reductase